MNPREDVALYRFHLPHLQCSGCVRTIERALKQCEEVPIERFYTDIIGKTLTVLVRKQVDNPQSPQRIRQQIKTVLKNAGQQAEQVAGQGIECEPIVPQMHWALAGLGLGSGGLLVALSLLLGPLPLGWMVVCGVVSCIITVYLGMDSFKSAVKEWTSNRTLTMDTLFTFSTITVLVVSLAALFIPGLPSLFESGLLIFGFRHMGLAIEDTIKSTMRLGVKFADRVQGPLRVFVGGQEVPRSLDEIQAGDTLVIHAGEVIPFDGVCLEDTSAILDTLITGHSLPRQIKKGDPLLAGMQLPQTIPSLRMESLAPASYLQRLDDNIVNASFQKAPLQAVTNRILDYFIPSVFLLAVLSGITVGYFFTPALAIQCVVSVLVSACPCTLGFVTPLAIRIGMQKASNNGVQFKNDRYLEEASAIDCVVFDLNGTLNTGVFSIEKCGIAPDSGMDQEDLLRHMATIEAHSTHAVARAIRDYAVSNLRLETMSMPVTEVDTTNHSGIIARLGQHQFMVGNQTLMLEKGIDLSAFAQVPTRISDSLIYLARDNIAVGYVVVSNPIRNKAKEAVQRLKQLGKSVHICTGGNEDTALRYAEYLGISAQQVAFGCSSFSDDAATAHNSKEAYIRQLQANGLRVAMVGDAGNDVPAMKASELGIALKSPLSDVISRDEAGVYIGKIEQDTSGALLSVVNAFVVAQQTVSNIKQNLLFNFGYNFAVLLLATGCFINAGIVLNPGIGVFLMIVQTTLILTNAARFRYQKLASSEEYGTNNTPHYGGNPYQHFTPSPSASPSPRSLRDEAAQYTPLYVQGALEQPAPHPHGTTSPRLTLNA